MEGWKDGGVEGWRDGRMEGWKDGRMEGWKGGRMEGWKDGKSGAQGGEPTQPSNLPFFQSSNSSLERAFACVSDSSTLGSAVPRSKSKST